MAQIKCENVSLSYDGNLIVSDLNFEVNKGDYLCIVGENGSGKSTLVKTLLGLKTPNSGEVVFGDGLEQNEIGYLTFPLRSMRLFFRAVSTSSAESRFSPKRKKSSPIKISSGSALPISKNAVTESFRAVSSKEFFSRERFVRRKRYCFLTNRPQGLTRR